MSVGWCYQVLRSIAQFGPELLLNVNDVYTMCVDSGLVPLSPLHSLVLHSFNGLFSTTSSPLSFYRPDVLPAAKPKHWSH